MTPRGELLALDGSPPFRAVQALCVRAENEIRLLERTRPRNANSERSRLLAELLAGRAARASFEYQRAPELGALRAELERAGHALEACGPLGTLYAARVRELACEAALVEALGAHDFAQRAASRFPLERGRDGEAAERWARDWTRAPPPLEPGLHFSDDTRDPHSLISVLRRRALELGVALRVEVRDNQTAAAAVGEGFIAVRAGLHHSAREVERISLHELEGHALPRQRAQCEQIALFRVGSAASTDDEEGRALWLEEKAGLWDDERRAELGLRHLAARAARDGIDFSDACRELLRHGVSPERVLDAALRAYRGGGLGRELVYLTALSRVARTFAEEPALAGWLARGRLSLDAARALSALE